MEEPKEKTSREILKEYGFSEIVLFSMTDDECDQVLKNVIFL